MATSVLNQECGENWSAYNCDCIEGMNGIPDETVGLSIFSPPFADLFTYSNSERDLGNCLDEQQFFAAFGFVVAELFRVLMPGRITAVHCMDMPRLKSKAGFIGVYDFPGDLIRCFESHGFQYDGRCTIWKNPVTAMQRTKSIRLLHKQIVKDSTVSGWALPDYVLKFKKPGENPEPVAGEFDFFAGDHSTFRSAGKLSIDIWQRYASPVWMDIDASRTLQRDGREDDDERHICPLQLDVIERCMQLWSNPGDVVLTPFGGIGSEGVVAVKMERKAVLFELKESYWKVAVKNLRRAEDEMSAGRLF